MIYFRERFAEGFNIANANALFEDSLHLSYDELNEQGPTNLVERLAIAVNSFYAYYTGDSIRLWSSSIVMLAVLAMLGWQNWLLALALSMLIPLNYFGYRALNKELMQRSRVAQESTSSGWQEILSVTANVDYLNSRQITKGAASI